MKLFAIALTSAGLLAAAGSASAAVSDVDYLKANRCRGLAASGIASVVRLDGARFVVSAPISEAAALWNKFVEARAVPAGTQA